MKQDEAFMRKADEVVVDLLNKGLPTNLCVVPRDVVQRMDLPFYKQA